MSLAILSRAHRVSPYLRRGNILINSRNEFSTINRNRNFINPFTASPISNGLEGVEVNYNRKLRLFHITSYQFSTIPPNTGDTNNEPKEIQPDNKNKQLVEVKPISFGTRVNNLVKRAGTKIMDEIRHYWTGTKLLGYETFICMQLIRKITKGHTLTRREKRQLTRTAGDLLRLIPFAIIIIVPFMELALPFILKLFPSMLPSTFRNDKLQKEEQRKKELKAKIQVAKFLQEAIFEKSISKMNTKKAEEFKTFMEDVKNGVYIDNNDILKYASVFQDEFTLDQLSREQLIAMSQYMQLNTIGTNTLLRYQLTRTIEQLKADDKLIESEGIDSLNLSELQQACAARGLKATSRSKQYLRERLSEWLDLSLKRNLPVSLLILANAFKITSTTSTKDALRDAIYHLPHSVVDEIKINIESSGDANQLKIQLLKEENQKIKEEAKEVESAKDQIELIDLQDWIKREKDIAQSSVTFTAAQLKAITEAVANVAANSSIETERKQLQELKTLLEKRKLELQSEEVPKEVPTPLLTSSVPLPTDTVLESLEKQKILTTLPQMPEPLPQPVQSEETMEKKRVEEVKEKEKEKEMEKEKESIAKISGRLEKYVQDLQDTVDKNYSVMMSLDKNGDGMVDLAEIQEAAKHYKQALPEELVNHVIARLDADSDGKIKLEELQKFAEKYVIKTKTPVGDAPAAITQEENANK